METIISKTAGFCNGVKNSVDKTLSYLEMKDNKLYCLGDLVHNDQVIKSLIDKGLSVINDIKDIDNCKLIIRAHGIPKETYDFIKNKNINLIDLTCPKVLAIHKLVQNLSNKEYFIVLVGHKEHPETIGTLSFCGNNSIVIESLDELKELPNNIKKYKDIAIISQTTYSLEKFENICNFLKDNLDNKNIKIFNTICNVTKNRQIETAEIAKKVDMMIIIGDKKSSNTKKLYEISNNLCKNTLFIQNICDLYCHINIIKKVSKIGITTGASTPYELVNDVNNYLKSL